jgi:hypothetical protein
MGTGPILGVKRTSKATLLTDRSNFPLAILSELVLGPENRRPSSQYEVTEITSSPEEALNQ